MKTKTKIQRPLALNSEGEAFSGGEPLDGWEPRTKGERDLLALWKRGMAAFRNWEEQRKPGGKFSQVETCWMPAATLDRKPLLLLSAEFSAEGCWLAKDREQDGKPCLPAARVKGALDTFISDWPAPSGVKTEVVETDASYFELLVTATTEFLRRGDRLREAALARDQGEQDALGLTRVHRLKPQHRKAKVKV
jgi:hypothetical protein